MVDSFGPRRASHPHRHIQTWRPRFSRAHEFGWLALIVVEPFRPASEFPSLFDRSPIQMIDYFALLPEPSKLLLNAGRAHWRINPAGTCRIFYARPPSSVGSHFYAKCACTQQPGTNPLSAGSPRMGALNQFSRKKRICSSALILKSSMAF